MLQLRIGIQLASLAMPLKKALHTAARLGARGVEIDARGELKPEELSHTGVRQLRKMLDDQNLRVSAVGFRTRRGYDVVDGLDRRVEATKQALRMAAALQAPVVINHVGRVPHEASGAGWELMLQTLTELGRFGHHIGALLAAETGTESGPDLAQLLTALPDGLLLVNLDPGNLLINGFSVAEAVRALGPYIAHVHAKDAVRDLAQGRGLEVPLGRGSVDFAALLAGLEEFTYQGYLTVEREKSSDPVTEIGHAVKYLQSLFQ